MDSRRPTNLSTSKCTERAKLYFQRHPSSGLSSPCSVADSRMADTQSHERGDEDGLLARKARSPATKTHTPSILSNFDDASDEEDDTDQLEESEYACEPMQVVEVDNGANRIARTSFSPKLQVPIIDLTNDEPSSTAEITLQVTSVASLPSRHGHARTSNVPENRLVGKTQLDSSLTSRTYQARHECNLESVLPKAGGKKRKRSKTKDDEASLLHRKRLSDKNYRSGVRERTKIVQEELKSVIPKAYLDAVEDVSDIKIFMGASAYISDLKSKNADLVRTIEILRRQAQQDEDSTSSVLEQASGHHSESWATDLGDLDSGARAKYSCKINFR